MTDKQRSQLIKALIALFVVVSVCVIIVIGGRVIALTELERNGAILQTPNCSGVVFGGRLWGFAFVRKLITASLPVHSICLMQATGPELIYLRRFPELRQLDLHGGSFDNESLSVVDTLVNLEEFWILCNDRVTDAGLRHLRHCRRLRSVIIAGSSCDGTFLETLECMESLTHLEITLNSQFGDEGLLQLERFPRLREIDVSSCYGFEGYGFGVFDRLNNVQRLTTWIPDESVRPYLLKILEVDIEK